jgi:hypothetical protein
MAWWFPLPHAARWPIGRRAPGLAAGWCKQNFIELTGMTRERARQRPCHVMGASCGTVGLESLLCLFMLRCCVALRGHANERRGGLSFHWHSALRRM